MKSKITEAILVVAAMFLAIPMGHAQNNIGFRVGIAPSPPPMAVMMQPVHPVQPFQQFGVSPISASGLVNTIRPLVITNFLGSSHIHPVFAPSPAPAVIVQTRTINVYAPTYVVAPIPQPRLNHHERRLPAPGTPRAHVISQWGTPVVSILTSNGETLQYSGGIVIILQNGLVAPQ